MIETFEEIEARRARAGFSWRRVCMESKVSPSTVHRLQQQGGDVASVDTVKRLAAGLDALVNFNKEVGSWLNVREQKKRVRRKREAAQMP